MDAAAAAGEEEEDEEEAPWEGHLVAAGAGAAAFNFANALPVEGGGGGRDEFDDYVRTLRGFTPQHFPQELYNLIRNEMEGPYTTWLRGLRGQPLEHSIFRSMANLGYLNPATMRLTIPEPSVVQANARLEGIEEAKKAMNYVIHRIQDYRLGTAAGAAAAGSADNQYEENKEDEAVRPGGDATENAINAVLAKLVMLADNIYKVMDAATIMCMNFTMLLENAYPERWFRTNDLTACEFQKFLYISRPIAMEDAKKFDRHTKLVIFLLDKFRERKFRKKATSDYLYQQVIFTREDGSKVCTYAYKPIKENIEQLVYSMVRKEYRGDLWSTILHAGILKDVVTYIKKSVDEEVPEVKEMPRMWSFEDGVYCAETDTFAYYDEVRDVFPQLVQGGYSTYKFMEGHTFAQVYYIEEEQEQEDGRDQHGASPGSVVTGLSEREIGSPHASPGAPPVFPSPNRMRMQYLEEQEEEDDDDMAQSAAGSAASPGRGGAGGGGGGLGVGQVRKRTLEEIGMPLLIKIFKDQGWSDETIFLKLATLGRTFWPGGALDNCQYWPCDWGVGGSGKSTVQDVFKYLFHWQDVGIFGADQEDTFSRDCLPDKRIIIAPEVRGENFGCSLAFFLAIVAGDSVRIPVKYGQPRDIENFNVQGLMATNELPKSYLNDPKGSVARRLLVFPWPRVISPRDPTLKTRILREELPAVLRACAVAYHQLPKDVDIMSDYPLAPEMAAARARLQRASNAMVDFLLSEDYVTMGEGLVVEMDALRRAFTTYVKEVRNERQVAPWNEDLYDYPFRLLGLTIDGGGEAEGMPAMVIGCKLRVEIE